MAGLRTIETSGGADPRDTGFEYSRLFRDLVRFPGVVWTGLDEQSVQLICQREANSVICGFENVFGVRRWTKSHYMQCEVKIAILLLHRPKNDSARTHLTPDLKKNIG